MANPLLRNAANQPGAYYIDEECIDCGLCREIAEDIFEANPKMGYHFVKMQPQTETQTALAEEALDSCPVEAIGRDGQDSSSAFD